LTIVDEGSGIDPRAHFVCSAVWTSETVGFLPPNGCLIFDPRGRISAPEFYDVPEEPVVETDEAVSDSENIIYYKFMSYGKHGCFKSGGKEFCKSIFMDYESGEERTTHIGPPVEITSYD